MVRHLLIAAVSFSCASVWAAPLITKISTTGANTKPEFSKSQKCEVFDDHVVITNSYGLADGSMVSTTREQSFTHSDGWQNLLIAAAQDSFTSTPLADCGYPETVVSLEDGTVLYDTGTCERPHIYRSGGATSSVLDFVNAYCPRTY
jgi:hypothetical protein